MNWHQHQAIIPAWLPLRKLMIGVSLFCVHVGTAQTTVVTGKVFDAQSKEPLPFVNIAFLNSKIGTTSDIDGNYRLETYYATDSIKASFVGYTSMTVKVKKDVQQTIDLPLSVGNFSLQEVVIKPSDENPAHAILRRLVMNKPVNDREKLTAYEYEAYNKVEFDLNNLTEDFMNKKLFRPFAFIFDNVDTAAGKPYLPIFMTESLSDVYYRQDPRDRREVIKGTKVSGLENKSVSQFLGDMYQNINIYDNFLNLFGKNFVSPIADQGKNYYDYYLTDSAYIGKNWCYKIEFKPKRKLELVFNGEMWINDTTYAVRRIEGGILDEINLNFVKTFWVKQEYEQVAKEVWMLVRDEMVADLNITEEKTLGLFGRRTATYKDFTVNQPRGDDIFSGPDEVIVLEDAESSSNEYWEKNRHVQLTEKEATIYHMVDTMKTIPQFRTYVDLITLMITGYHVIGKFEIGPYSSVYSFNGVEGHRFRLGGRTSNAFSTRVMIEGHAAYGTKDKETKFGLGAQGFVSKDPRQLVGLYYKNDMEQLGESQNAFRQDNLLSSVFRRNPATKLTKVEEFKGFYEREWFKGFSNTLQIRYRSLFPKGDLSYIRSPEGDLATGDTIPRIATAEISLNTRFAYREKFVSGEFTRVSLGTKYPIIELHAAFAAPNLFDSDDYEYQKLIARVRQRVPIGPFGHINYIVEGGRVWGTLPFPLLILHSGNETFYYDDQAFNMMNYFEFISDRYASVSLEHHLNGFFFNRVPLFRKLKFREVWTAKGVVGRLDPKHTNELALLPGMFSLNDGPYAEVSAGIENILKVLRFDAIWRLTYLDNPRAPAFTIRMKINIDF